MAHGRTEAFDENDAHLMTMLADFAAMGYRQQNSKRGSLPTKEQRLPRKWRISSPIRSTTHCKALPTWPSCSLKDKAIRRNWGKPVDGSSASFRSSRRALVSSIREALSAPLPGTPFVPQRVPRPFRSLIAERVGKHELRHADDRGRYARGNEQVDRERPTLSPGRKGRPRTRLHIVENGLQVAVLG